MDSKVTIKNFRAFDEEGITVDLKPITILTGCNSAGKSSMTKAVSLLNSFLSQIQKAKKNDEKIDLSKYSLDFTNYPNNLLGNFNSVVHKGTSTPEITFEYKVYSRMLANDITVQLVFATDENDGLRNGWLDKITISSDEGQIFSSDKKEGSVCNFNLIKNAGFVFMNAEFLVDWYCGDYSAYNDWHEMTKEEFEKQEKIFDSFWNRYNDWYKKNIVDYVRTRISTNGESILGRNKIHPRVVLWSEENDSLFNIPVIEDLNKLPKNEIKEWVNNNLLVSATKKIKFYTNRIIDDFIASGYSCFGDYFKSYERLFLERCKIDVLSLKKHNLLNGRIVYAVGNDANYDENEVNNVPISFELIYDVIMLWNRLTHDSENEYYQEWEKLIGFQYKTDHCMFNRLMTAFVYDLVLEVLSPNWCGNMEYASSSRAKINRLYALETEDDFSRLIKKYFEKRREFENETNILHKDTDYSSNKFLNKWVGKFGIGSAIELSTNAEGLGAQIRLFKSIDDKDGMLLADEGYGITQLFTVLLQIETAILSAKGERINRIPGLDSLDGYNSSKFHYEINTILIEEPEIHLHPNYQSRLADMLVDAYQNYNIHFIVETHSEYLIRKLQVLVAENKVDLNEISLNYFDNPDFEKRGPYTPQLKTIDILPDGRLADKFGEGFFDEADKLSLELLTH